MKKQSRLKDPESGVLFYFSKWVDIIFCYAIFKKFLDSSKSFDIGPLEN